MKRIFEEYGGVLITVIAVLALIAFVTFSMSSNGVISKAFHDMVGSFVNASDELVDSAAGSYDGDDALILDVKDGKVPEGWLYTPSSSGETLSAGSSLPGIMMAGDTLTYENSDYVYSLMKDGFATLDEARAYYKSYMEAMLGATWDELKAENGMTDDEMWVVVEEEFGTGLFDDTFVAADSEPYWAVSVKDKTKASYANDIYGELLDIPVMSLYGTFASCENLVDASNIDIPSSVSITEGTFADCDSLTSVIIPDGVTSIGSNAFSRCTSLTSITIPDSVTSIGDYAFDSCINLTSITIPDSVTSIGNNAFQICTSLTSITIPDSVTSIGSHAFDSCTSLTSITIPDNVTSIGSGVFSRCGSLTSITIPDNVTSISSDAFSSCTSLTSITIPDSVTNIGEYAFSGCTSLTSITFAGTMEQWNAIDKGSDWNFHVPATEVVCSDGVVTL